jgi:hypothetical protein
VECVLRQAVFGGLGHTGDPNAWPDKVDASPGNPSALAALSVSFAPIRLKSWTFTSQSR